MKVTINWTEKEIEFKSTYTHKMDVEFNNIMFNWMKANMQQLQAWSIDVEPARIQLANDFMITAMTNLTQDELDELSVADYNKVLAEVENIKIPSEK